MKRSVGLNIINNELSFKTGEHSDGLGVCPKGHLENKTRTRHSVQGGASEGNNEGFFFASLGRILLSVSQTFTIIK